MTKKSAKPVRGSSRRTNNRVSSHLETGSMEIDQVTLGTPSGTFVGRQYPLIPTFEEGSRLSRLAVQFSQYRIEHSRVSFVTQATTNTSGRIAMAWTFDPLESTPVSVHQLTQLSATRLTAVHKNITTAMPRGSPEKRRFSVIESAQFQALSNPDKLIYLPATLVVGTDGSAQSGLIVGSLIWHYRIRFYNNNLVIGALLTEIKTLASPIVTGPVPTFASIEAAGWDEEPGWNHDDNNNQDDQE